MPSPITGAVAIVRRFRLQWEPAQGCHVLLYPEGMIKLNDSAAEILKRCDGTRTIDGILADLHAAFPGAELDASVHEFMEIAHGRGWIAGV